MDLLACLGWLLLLNTITAASFLAFFSLVGCYWVKRRTPVWLHGPGLYTHYFLDGLEYFMTRTALALSMARNVLVFKLMEKSAKQPTAPVAAPKMPLKQSEKEGEEAKPSAATTADSATTKGNKGRVRARILPPGHPSVVGLQLRQ